MAQITAEMKTLIEQHRIGYVASVGSDGTPNLSPKATMVVPDDDHIMFGDLRSPNTIENIQAGSVVELNFIDVFARRGFRFKGAAAYFPKGEADFEARLPQFAAWGELTDRFRGIVEVTVERALPLLSPAYDDGATEAELVAEWREKYLGKTV